MAVKIEVTQEDIDQGVRCSAGRCPIARAMVRQGLTQHPEVGHWEAFELWEDDGVERQFSLGLLPPEASLFVGEFDHGKPVQPFAFELIPTPR